MKVRIELDGVLGTHVAKSPIEFDLGLILLWEDLGVSGVGGFTGQDELELLIENEGLDAVLAMTNCLFLGEWDVPCCGLWTPFRGTIG